MSNTGVVDPSLLMRFRNLTDIIWRFKGALYCADLLVRKLQNIPIQKVGKWDFICYLSNNRVTKNGKTRENKDLSKEGISTQIRSEPTIQRAKKPGNCPVVYRVRELVRTVKPIY